MINGLYSGAAAMQTLAQHQEMISSNLMHANSSGHRRVQPAIKQRFEQTSPTTTLDLGPEVARVMTDFRPGRQMPTDRPLDVAIAGDGFFAFGTGESEVLTRNGRLFRSPDTGELVNEDGIAIQGQNGPIRIDPDASDRDITVASDGTVSVLDREVGRIRPVTFQDNNTLAPVGALAFRRTEQSVESDVDVKLTQFTHELSNVQPVSELINLIVNTRQHDAIQKATRTLSETLRDYIQS